MLHVLRCRPEDKVECREHQENRNCGPEGEATALGERSELEHAEREAITETHLEAEGNPTPLRLPLLTERGRDCNHAGCVKDIEEQEAKARKLAAVEHVEDSRRNIRLSVGSRVCKYAERTHCLLLCELRTDGSHRCLPRAEAKRRKDKRNRLTDDL